MNRGIRSRHSSEPKRASTSGVQGHRRLAVIFFGAPCHTKAVEIKMISTAFNVLMIGSWVEIVLFYTVKCCTICCVLVMRVREFMSTVLCCLNLPCCATYFRNV
jgi:hypothetical protein